MKANAESHQNGANFDVWHCKSRPCLWFVCTKGFLITNSIFHSHQVPQKALVDKFLMDIRSFTASVSDCTSPAGIILFGVSWGSNCFLSK